MTIDGERPAPTLLEERAGKVLILTLNRPEQANAIDPDLEAALSAALLAARADPEVQAIVLTGAGQRFFSSGVDVKPAPGGARRRRAGSPLDGLERSLFEILLQTYKPTLAAINGAAVGGGVDLALCCDLRVQAADGYLMLPEARRGMAAHISSILLPRAAPAAVAYEMLYLGGKLPASRAYEVGLLNRIAPADQVLATTVEMAQAIAANAPVSLRRIKETASKAAGLPLLTALHLNEGLSPYDTEDRREGMRAFIEKRDPVWKGR